MTFAICSPYTINLWTQPSVGEPDAGNRGEDLMRMTQHIVQPYKTDRRKRLAPDHPLVVRNATVARMRAEKLFDTGRHVGVDAYTVTSDQDAGEYGDPVFHIRLGRVPQEAD